MKRKDFLKGAKVIITDHALEQYLIRAEIMTQAEYNELESLANKGDKDARKKLDREKAILESKFRNTQLAKFLRGGVEVRREISGSKNARCTFITQKKGRLFVLITTYLQGKRTDHWKVGTRKEVRKIG
ncbi:hypothetical protein [Bacillus licheniformis]|uniref:hypothetical protein n=1 Tax=Bacillus subtilis group TaxID=653685 RepID=UPI0009B74CC0|nr:hypothetical protein [Bacillus licheniformis]ARC72602.1 hypothetical protein B37_00549 [Bacillus licheniformis]ARW56587.1 hypothetical protein S100027_04623 [Bacillus licheniformis]AXF87856.1 hypothetical protein BLDA23_06025 [Bacillus licheniformis]WCO63753.1 hypothetical protein OSR41_05235 [Bacillus licheniformis]